MQVAVVPHDCGGAARDSALLPIITGPDTRDRETHSFRRTFMMRFSRTHATTGALAVPDCGQSRIRTFAVNVPS